MMGCYIWYSEEGTGRGHNLPRPLLVVPNGPNVIAHLSTASVLITVTVMAVLLYNGPLLCCFNVPITPDKELDNLQGGPN